MRKKFIWAVLPLLLLLACSDEEAQPEAVVSFEESSSQVQEDGAYKTIDVLISWVMEEDVEVIFETSGSAVLNGHYALITPSPIVIEAGDTRAEIVFEAIDNTVLEPEPPTLIVELTSASGVQLEEAASLTHQVQIIDNDEVPENDLQLDLLWDLGPGEGINQVDLDLVLITDVEIGDEGIVDPEFTTVATSENEHGFETVVLQESHPDKEYYIAVFYLTGNHQVNFRIHASNGSFGTGLLVEDVFAEDEEEEQRARIFGPIPKEGNTYFEERKAGARFLPYKGLMPASVRK